MKTYFSDGSEMAHLWAHQTQSEGRTAGSNHGHYSRFYFEGATIYSYGSHFPIARHAKNKRRQAVVMMTYREASRTTMKHVGMVRHSIPDNVPIIYCYNPLQLGTLREHEENYKYFLNRIEEHGGKYERARKDFSKQWHLNKVNMWAERLKVYSSFYGLRWKLEGDVISAAKAKKDKLAKYFIAQAKIANAKLIKKREEDIIKWRAGEIDVIPDSLHFEKQFLRVSKDMEEIETSTGAKFPIEHGLKALKIIDRCVAQKAEWHTNGHTIHLGHYQIRSITKEGLVHAGCHYVDYAEIQAVAKQVKIVSEVGGSLG